ncbi:MAG TPA: hypothetical protein VEQ85_13945, partial [Lacipirellulaceae bacterium]|nr:hypothetical protein [Lacipirellulaceae bacterium]
MTICMPRSGFLRTACAAAILASLAPMARAATAEPAPPAEGDQPAPLTAPDSLPSLPPYLPKAPVAGELTLAGSTAMNQLAHLWASGLGHLHTGAKLQIQTYDSGQVLPRLA